MSEKSLSVLSEKHFQALLTIPESKLLGEIIRLNCTVYENSLDVIKISTAIRLRRRKVA